MGTQIVSAVSGDERMEVVGAFDPGCPGKELVAGDRVIVCSGDLGALIDEVKPDVMVDFTRPDVVSANVACALSKGVHCVVGTTGVTEEEFARIHAENAYGGANLFIAPNFTTGAVLMMVFSKMAAQYFPDAEVIEFHHNGKKDSPSGTSTRTAQLIAEGRGTNPTAAPGKETEIEGCEGARGALVCGVPVHSVRTDGYVAHQEVIFGSHGQTLTIRHDSIDRASYMPGVLLAISKVQGLDGVVVGLEKLMDL